MAAREIPGLATVLGRIDGAMAPAAEWCERHGVSHMYELKELGDESEIEAFIVADQSGRFGQVGRHRRLKRLRLGARRRYVSRYFV